MEALAEVVVVASAAEAALVADAPEVVAEGLAEVADDFPYHYIS